MRTQVMACLLCLLIVGGSFDGLPDPPAVKPQGNQSKLRSQADHRVPVAAMDHAADCVACTTHSEARLFLAGQLLRSSDRSFSLALVRRAADSSPPCHS
jgi:hypothetical protein